MLIVVKRSYSDVHYRRNAGAREDRHVMKRRPTKGDVKMKSGFVLTGFMLSVLFFSLTASVCQGADYATDKGSNMFGIVAGIVNAGGDLYEDDEGNSSTTLLIMPGMAHFLWSNLGLGGDLLILNSKQGETGLSTLGIGPKAMYFFGGPGSKALPYFTCGVYYVTNTIDHGKDAETSSGTRLKFGGGASIMLTDHLGLLMEAAYNLDNLKTEGEKESESGNMLIICMGLSGFTF